MDYNRIHNEFQALLDSINHDSDPTTKLNNIQRLYKEGLTTLIRYRDEAAYELRTKYSSQDAEQIAKISRRHIDYWAKRHMKRYAKPPLKQMRRIDLSNVIDLSASTSPTSP